MYLTKTAVLFVLMKKAYLPKLQVSSQQAVGYTLY